MLETGQRYGSIPGQAEALLQLSILQIALGEFPLAKQTARRAEETILRLGPAHELRFGITDLTSLLNYFPDVKWAESAATATLFAASPEAGRKPLCAHRAGDRGQGLLTVLTPVIEQMEPTRYVHHAAVAFGGTAVWEIGATESALTYRRMALDLIAAGFGDRILAQELTIARMAVLLGRPQEAREYFALSRAQSEAEGLKPVRAITDYDEALALIREGTADRNRLLLLLDATEVSFQALEWI